MKRFWFKGVIAAAATAALLSGCVDKVLKTYPTLTIEEFVAQADALVAAESVQEANGEVLVTLDPDAAKGQFPQS